MYSNCFYSSSWFQRVLRPIIVEMERKKSKSTIYLLLLLLLGDYTHTCFRGANINLWGSMHKINPKGYPQRSH